MSGVVVVLGDALVAALVALLHRVDLESGVQRDVVPEEKKRKRITKKSNLGEYLDGTTWVMWGFPGEYFAH